MNIQLLKEYIYDIILSENISKETRAKLRKNKNKNNKNEYSITKRIHI